MFGIFPLLALAVIAFNAVVFFGGVAFGMEDPQNAFIEIVVTIPMISGDAWTITLGDLFIVGSLCLLFLEIVKATHTGTTAILNHGFSLLVFVVCLIEFLMLEGFGNTTFFIIMAMALLDVIAGFTVSISTARRDVGLGGGVFGS